MTKSVSSARTRRRLVQLVTALPLAGVVAGLLLEEHVDGQGNGAGVGGGGGRRRRRARHHPGQGKHTRKGKDTKVCATAGQTPETGKRTGCCQGLSPDASGRCATPAPGPTPDPDPTPVPCTGLTPTATGATKGLQEAIDTAEAGDTLTLCAGTWTLTSPITIGKNLTLIGAGADVTVLDGGYAVRVLQINAGATVTLQDLTITNGRASFGGGILTVGALTLLGVHVSGNFANGEGGGISNQGTVTLQTGSQVTGNGALDGAGIWNIGGTVTLQTGSLVSGNSAGNVGGGIGIAYGTATLKAGSRVTGNTAGNIGGGIWNETGGVTLEGADSSLIVVNNCPDNCGGSNGVPDCAATPVSCP